MSEVPGLLVFLLAFLSASISGWVILYHYRPRVSAFLRAREREVAESFRALYAHERNARLYVGARFLGAPALVPLLFLLTGSWVLGIAGGLLLFAGPPILLGTRIKGRRERIRLQVVDLISSLVATAKAGMNLHQSLQEVAERLPTPLSQECAVILARVRAGQSLEVALEEADGRLRIANASLVFQTLVVHEQRGGPLPALLERIGQSLREIEKVEERVRTETAGIELASRIMAAMPLIVCFLLYLASPSHVLMLFETTLGNLLIAGALALDYVGFTLIRRLGELEV